MKKKVLKGFIIWLLLTCIVTFVDWGIRQYKTYRYNKTHWITVTIKDIRKCGIIKDPIVMKIHPGEEVEFPQLELFDSGLGGWLYWQGYYGEDDNYVLEPPFGVYENDRFYQSITIYPVRHPGDPYGGDTQGTQVKDDTRNYNIRP